MTIICTQITDASDIIPNRMNNSTVSYGDVNSSRSEGVHLIYDLLLASGVNPIEERDNLLDLHWRVIGRYFQVIWVGLAIEDINRALSEKWKPCI